MQVIEIDVKQGQYCFECGIPDKFLVNLAETYLCLDCLDRAVKIMLTRIEEISRKSRGD